MAIRFKQTLQIGNVRLELRARIGIGNKRSHAYAFHHATRRMNIKLTLNGGLGRFEGLVRGEHKTVRI